VSLEPPSIADPTNLKLIHLADLCLSRAWMLEGIVDALSLDTQQDSRDDQLLELSKMNAQSRLMAIYENHHGGGHLLGTFCGVFYHSSRNIE
jgi:hypothetical protein